MSSLPPEVQNIKNLRLKELLEDIPKGYFGEQQQELVEKMVEVALMSGFEAGMKFVGDKYIFKKI